jgi:hypothetical protein
VLFDRPRLRIRKGGNIVMALLYEAQHVYFQQGEVNSPVWRKLL